MENSTYNSLAEKLKQSGILADAKEPILTPKENNMFLNGMMEGVFSVNQNVDETIKETNETTNQEHQNNPPQKQVKKRINRYDLELISDKNKPIQAPPSLFSIFKRLISLRRMNMENSKAYNFKERFLNGLFPKLYKIKIAKDAVKRLNELDIDTEALLNKSVPYGESEFRYKNLVKYLNYANEIQTKLNKEFD